MRRGTKRALEFVAAWAIGGGALITMVGTALHLGHKQRIEREAAAAAELAPMDSLVGTLTIDDHIFELQRADQVRLREIRSLRYRLDALEKANGIVPPEFDGDGHPVAK